MRLGTALSKHNPVSLWQCFDNTVVGTTTIDREKVGDRTVGKQRVVPNIAVIIHPLLTVGDKGAQSM